MNKWVAFQGSHLQRQGVAVLGGTDAQQGGSQQEAAALLSSKHLTKPPAPL